MADSNDDSGIARSRSSSGGDGGGGDDHGKKKKMPSATDAVVERTELGNDAETCPLCRVVIDSRNKFAHMEQHKHELFFVKRAGEYHYDIRSAMKSLAAAAAGKKLKTKIMGTKISLPKDDHRLGIFCRECRCHFYRTNVAKLHVAKCSVGDSKSLDIYCRYCDRSFGGSGDYFKHTDDFPICFPPKNVVAEIMQEASADRIIQIMRYSEEAEEDNPPPPPPPPTVNVNLKPKQQKRDHHHHQSLFDGGMQRRRDKEDMTEESAKDIIKRARMDFAPSCDVGVEFPDPDLIAPIPVGSVKWDMPASPKSGSSDRFNVYEPQSPEDSFLPPLPPPPAISVKNEPIESWKEMKVERQEEDVRLADQSLWPIEIPPEMAALPVNEVFCGGQFALLRSLQLQDPRRRVQTENKLAAELPHCIGSDQVLAWRKLVKPDAKGVSRIPRTAPDRLNLIPVTLCNDFHYLVSNPCNEDVSNVPPSPTMSFAEWGNG